jgi:SAM-dependent methyltransferase
MTDPSTIDAQKAHWQRMFAENPDMYGRQTSEPGRYAIDLFTRDGAHDLLELGAGQGRDTLGFLSAGFHVTAIDYEGVALQALEGRASGLTVAVHDVREPLTFPDASFDAVYSHMLFNMALKTTELERLSAEVNRVLRSNGLHVYTVRHVGDDHYGTGIRHGDDLYEHGGFIVHFFDQPLVQRLAQGFTTPEIFEFEEGDLPRRLWRITQRKVKV